MTEFKESLAADKQKIDTAILTKCNELLAETKNSFGEYPAEAVHAYCEILKRGGKRIRGILAMKSFYMHGGEDDEIALQTACIVEMLQAYILITDDIQDESIARRGGPSAHILLKNLHQEQSFAGNSEHFGESIAMNAMLIGVHTALNELADLSVNAELKIKAIKNINNHFVSTAHGQSLDIFNEVTKTTDEAAVNQVLVWKTAYYTILNPIQLGAILAGVDESNLDQFVEYSLAVGRAFQITDDIIGIFGDDELTGKSAMDDIKEGKRTVLSVKALELSNDEDAKFLEDMLGNKDLNRVEFDRCKSIIDTSGALDYAREEANMAAIKAIEALGADGLTVSGSSKLFLKNLVGMILERNK